LCLALLGLGPVACAQRQPVVVGYGPPPGYADPARPRDWPASQVVTTNVPNPWQSYDAQDRDGYGDQLGPPPPWYQRALHGSCHFVRGCR
jgi:hypothetical protein